MKDQHKTPRCFTFNFAQRRGEFRSPADCLGRLWPAAVVSGLIFGAAHYANGGPQAANAVAFGTATAYIAIRSGGLAFTFGMHLVNTLVGAVVVVSADDVFRGAPALITQHEPQLMWWAVALQVAALAAAVLVARAVWAPALDDQDVEVFT